MNTLLGPSLLGSSLLGLGSVSWTTLVSVLLAWVIPVEVTTRDGETQRGQFAGISPQGVRIDQDGRLITVSQEEISKLVPIDLDEKTRPKITVMLHGGSKLAVRGIQWGDDQLLLTLPRQGVLAVPVQQVRAIRFRSGSPTTDPVWLGILEKESRGDTLVINRSTGKLDSTTGIVEGIADGKVKFNLDGQTVQAPTTRLEGIVFGASAAEVPPSTISLVDVYGSRWALTELVASEQQDALVVKLGNINHQIPINLVKFIQWSGGVTMLATTPPAESNVTPSFNVNVDRKLLTQLFGPQRVDQQDLLVRGGSTIEYRMDREATTFVGSIHRDTSVKSASEVTVRILFDEKVVWEESFPDAQTRGFELPVEGARRLKIEVDSGTDSDLGATVRFTRPRLLK